MTRCAALLWLMSLAVSGAEPTFRAVTIDGKIQIGYGVAVADVDGDKKPDILLADKRQFVWYRNPTWEKFVMAENLTPKDNVCLAAQDLDGDGKCEVAVGGEWNPGDTENSGAVFYLIAPEDRTQRWEAVKLHAEPTVHRMRWVWYNSTWRLLVAPLHGRGNQQGAGAGARLLEYTMAVAGPRGEWTTEVLSDTLHLTHNIDVFGPESKSHEVVVASKEGLFGIRKLAPIPFLEPSAMPSFTGAGEVRRGMDSSREFYLASVEPMHGNMLYVNGPAGKARQLLTDKLVEGHALACGDVLGAGYDQIVVGWRGNAQQPRDIGIKIYSHEGATGTWREAVVDVANMACEDLTLADLNGDGRLDIVASGRSTKNVVVYFNETPRGVAVP